MNKSRRRFAPTPIILSGLTLAALLNTVGCSGDDDSEPGPPSTSSSPAAVQPPPADVALGTLTGKLSKAESARVVTNLSDVVLTWFDDAYLAGDYPREGFDHAFGTFTTGAAKQARRDGALMSNGSIGERIEAVTTKGRRVRLDLLAVHHHVVGATARVALVFTTEGAFAHTVTIKGKVFLTPAGKSGWRIFGYDMTRGVK
jgi:hypothetical protein